MVESIRYVLLRFPNSHLSKSVPFIPVYFVVILDLIQTGLSTHSSYHTFVLYYGNPLVLQIPAKTIIGLSLFGGLGECFLPYMQSRAMTKYDHQSRRQCSVLLCLEDMDTRER